MSRVYLGYEKYGLEGVDSEYVQFIFDVVVSMVGLDEDAEVGLVLTDNEQMHRLNKKYRGKDKPTNVLSFGYAETKDEVEIPNEDKHYIGDVYMSYTLVTEEAEEMNIKVKQRFSQLFVHGLLHLAGIHHDTEKDADRMEAMEDEILGQIGAAE
ncbi:MAG: rRNA maturation RNase YbeY [Patescibacteria group bacterium]